MASYEIIYDTSTIMRSKRVFVKKQKLPSRNVLLYRCTTTALYLKVRISQQYDKPLHCERLEFYSLILWMIL